MSVLPSLTGPQITFTAIHSVQWHKTFIQSHVLFLGKYLFQQVPDIFLTTSTSRPLPGLPAQKISPGWSWWGPATMQASQCLVLADNTAWFQKGKSSGASLAFLVIPLHVIVTGTLLASVRRDTLHFAEFHW